ncbi:MAG TPA: NAD+ synthase [Candidatus Desulfofervidus auxilii]|uniref:Glutamine-dependent NAD(+) synthetase n=1 Tax=Desulfofervidus auxilii TaxID=1621989 RepID=A0A7C0U333_DESA2|nr:NAD+ synthase [Candidatus Desulfofervidus auxilii]
MKIALAQTNPIIGAFDYNLEKVSRFIDEAKKQACDLIIFPELTLIGYPPKDLLEREDFINNSLTVLENLIQRTQGIAVICGAVERHTEQAKPLCNVALLFKDKKIMFKTRKILLPSYDVFDETRYFAPGQKANWIEWQGVRFGITICEDIWNDKDFFSRREYAIDPVAQLANENIEVLINISASAYFIGKPAFRLNMFKHLAQKYNFPIIYVNQVGGNDDLVFDGNSQIVLPDKTVLVRAKDFDEDLVVTELKKTGGEKSVLFEEEEAEVLKALILGTRDYAYKTGFKKAVVGLSGGVDSSLVAYIATKAFGKENVLGVAMPSPYTSKESLEDAEALAKNLNISFKIIPITQIFEAYLETLKPFFGNLPWNVAEENIQARIRGNILMALSNKFGYLVLSSGNKSEMAVGYCTLYGDLTGGLAVISDVPKTLVYRLARYVNREKEIIPQRVLTKAPSAELRAGQRDEDDLPPYALLDPILKEYVENRRSLDEIVSMGFPPETVKEIVRLVDRNEYKRHQAPPGIKITTKAFGYGRRYPIVQKYTEYLLKTI